MSWQASSWALKQRVGDPILKILLLAAANYADPDGKCWPKVETLAFDSEVSKRTIQRKLGELQALGLIRVIPQYDQKGKQIQSMIYLLMDGEGVTLAPLEVGVTPECHGEGDTTLSPTESMNKQKNKQTRTSSKKEGVYSEEFENDIWKPYPRKLYGSKKKAWDRWRMLTGEQQAQVKAAVPLFAAGMIREGRPEDKIKHLQNFISERIYETVAPSIVPPAAGGPAKPFWETATRKQWGDALLQWSQNWNWSRIWGPEPENPLRPNPAGAPKHHVPQDILDRFDLKYRGHLYSHEELAAIKARVEAAEASKHAVDKERAA